MKNKHIIRTATLASILGLSASHAATLILNPVIDGFARQDQGAVSGTGNATADLLIGQTSGTNAFHGFLNFNLASLPVDAIVTSASLKLTVASLDGGSAPATVTLALYTLTEAFTHDSFGSSSWNNRINDAGGVSSADTLWTTPGGTFAPGALSSGTFATAVTSGVGRQDVFGSTASFISAIESHAGIAIGFLVKDTVESNSARELFRYAAVENATLASRPELTITYEIAAVPEPGAAAALFGVSALLAASLRRRTRSGAAVA